MKLALIFLSSVLVVFSYQPRERFPDWFSPYQRQPAFNNYNYGGSGGQSDDTPFFNSIKYREPYYDTLETQNDFNEHRFPYGLSRSKVTNDYPLSLEQEHRYNTPAQNNNNNKRILINLASRTNFTNLLNNLKTKTITFVAVTSLTYVKTLKCIPAVEFIQGSSSVTCGRKRRGIVEAVEEKSDEIQFEITPSDVQPVEPTVLSQMELTTRMNRQISNGQTPTDDQGIVSSKDEEVSLTTTPTAASNYSRQKRFLFVHFVTTTTSISYTVISETTTKTVTLLNSLAYQQLACLPDGYAVCSSSSVLYGG